MGENFDDEGEEIDEVERGDEAEAAATERTSEEVRLLEEVAYLGIRQCRDVELDAVLHLLVFDEKAS